MTNPLYDKLFRSHAKNTKPFLYLSDGRTLAYKDFITSSSKMANALIKLGLKPGDRLAIQVEKSPEMLTIYAACAQAGIIFLPLNTAYTANELLYFIEDSGARIFICDENISEEVSKKTSHLNIKIETLNANGTGSLIDLALASSELFYPVERNEDDLAALLYTSGTTGKSKGAMLTQSNLLSNGQTLMSEWRFTEEDILLHALPLFHTHGLFVATNVVLAAGSSMVFLPKFGVESIINNLPNSTTMMGVPTFYTRLLNDSRFTKSLVSHMRLFISGSAPLLSETHIKFEKRTGHRILERYGMTETNMNTSNPYDGERRAGTVGFPLPGVEIKITNSETQELLEKGSVGLIEVRGANVFKGYWNMPEKTKTELRDDGFFITGDLGKFDADGYLHIVGRDKDLIISGGYNIYPKELEMFLDEQEYVLESAVIGIAHPDFGETPLALIVPQEGKTPDLKKIMENIQKEIARFKHPGQIILIEKLPRNTMGKVQKNLLRKQYKNNFEVSKS